MRVVAYAYPWDVATPGFVDRVRELGVDEVAVAVSYHSARAATPWSHTGTAVYARHAAFYRPVREGVWGKLTPGVPDWTASPDSAGEAVSVLNDAGIPAAAWLVLTHNSLLGQRFPELTVRNCFGERYPWALCPSHEEVRAYAATLVEEALAGLDVSSVILEACGQLGAVHQCSHEKTGAVWSPAVARLLSVCCCDACGLADSFRDDVLRLLATGDLTTADDPALRAELLEPRQKATDLLRHAVLAKISAPVTLHADLDPWATGALPGLTPGAAEEVATVVLPCWQPGEGLVAEARTRLPSKVGIGAYVTALGPAPDLRAYVARLRDAGADQVHLYHLGLAGPARWAELHGAVASARA
ncbi:hypothetical protein FHX82_003481 [Amycolatopsis bartoniae]|uniref:Uncharacterized protein n=1 Tax=Amycolatopsis bartoniae TaxID=941986 RepID=A0A8H9IW85_9PSEU|nr:hypothetical protein [Amycolatopsis bartoniae]MBB2936417.1 hypothetical protein [Amycolatopsis bartoniae]TVT11094.1 hypothetical protein FNH07_03645 [Amycolatopsis bartoniae]GHF69082.1 hypothetical protein GCM10017566_48720 [Amycolatopsis bartoniae]